MMSESDDKTQATTEVSPEVPYRASPCLVIIYAPDRAMLGKRVNLDQRPLRVGRSVGNHLVLDGDSVSRRHAYFGGQDVESQARDEIRGLGLAGLRDVSG